MFHHTITHDTGASLTWPVLFQSLLYKNAKDASHRSRLSSEMMIYHMTVSRDEFCLVNISETVSESYRNIERNASEMLQFSVESQVLNVHPKKNLLTTYKVSRALFHINV